MAKITKRPWDISDEKKLKDAYNKGMELAKKHSEMIKSVIEDFFNNTTLAVTTKINNLNGKINKLEIEIKELKKEIKQFKTDKIRPKNPLGKPRKTKEVIFG